MKKINLLTITLLISIKVFSCGGYDEYYYESSYYNFFDQYLLADKNMHAFLHCPESPFCTDIFNSDNNLNDWLKFFKENPKIEDIETILYKSSISDLVILSNAINGVKITDLENEALEDNSLFRYLKKNKSDNVLAYMIFAKKCENMTYKPYYSWNQGEGWDAAEHQGPEFFNDLIEEGKSLYKIEKNDFLKARIGFQLVRLAHYDKKYQKAIDYFNKYISKTSKANYIYYRALEQKAGALHRLGLKTEAALDFIEVFKKLSDRREVCLNSLKIESQSLWSSIANKSNHEPALYFMRAFKNGSELHEMENIVKYHVNSPYLDVLMLRYLNKIESGYFEKYGYNNEISKSNIERFNNLIGIIKVKKTKDKELWTLAEAYTNIFLSKTDTAISMLKSINSSQYKKQADILKYIAKIEARKDSISEEDCNNLFVELMNSKLLKSNKEIEEFLMNKISRFYVKNQRQEIAGLCINAYSFDAGRYELMDYNYIARFEAFMNTTNPNELESYLIKKLPDNIEDILIEMRGTYYLQNFKPDLAYKEFQKLPKNFEAKYYSSETKVNGGNPLYGSSLFSGAIRHYYDYPYKDKCDKVHENFNELKDEDVIQNKKDLAKMLMEVQQKASKNTANSALYYYMLGNAWYNLSDYGWHRKILQYQQTGGSKDLFSYTAKFDDNIPINYYKKALNLTNDKELKAKIYYMMAKTVQYSQGYPPLYRESFAKLKNEYRNTLYYKEVIKECEYFDKYVNPEKYQKK